MVPTPPALISWDVVSEHLDEAEFLLELWEASLRSPLTTLAGRPAGLEARLEAHLDGLVVGGPAVAERLLEPELEEARAAERATVAALVILSGGGGRRNAWREVLEAVTYADDERQRRALARAIELYDAPHFETVLLDAFAYARSPREKAALVAALSARRADPGEGLADCLGASYQPLAVAAVAAVGRAGRGDLLGAVERHLDASESDLRMAAIEAGLSLGSARALDACRRETGAGALLLLAQVGDEGDHERVAGATDDAATRDAAIFALGFAGRVASVDRCLPFLESDDPRTAKLAAEAIEAITGLGFASGGAFALETAEDRDRDGEDLWETRSHDPVDLLPRPNPEAVVAWWGSRRGDFDPGERYLGGGPLTVEALVAALRTAPMRRRHALARELSIRTGGRAFVDTAAFNARQLRQIGESEEALSSPDRPEVS